MIFNLFEISNFHIITGDVETNCFGLFWLSSDIVWVHLVIKLQFFNECNELDFEFALNVTINGNGKSFVSDLKNHGPLDQL